MIRSREQLHPVHVVFTVLAMSCLMAHLILTLGAYSVSADPFRSPLFLGGFALLGLARLRWPFKPPQEPISPEALALLMQRSKKPALYAAAGMALAFACGAYAVSTGTTTRVTAAFGVALAFASYFAVRQWHTRRGAPLPN